MKHAFALASLAALVILLWPAGAGEPGSAPGEAPGQAPGLAPGQVDADAVRDLRVLVFSKTAGFRHGSIPDGIQCFRELAQQGGFVVDATEDASVFTPGVLRDYGVVVFLNTTGDVLDEHQQQAFENWFRDGGGYLGVHSASDTEHDWPWYGQLVGAYFRRHPAVQQARIAIVTPDHPATAHLSKEWVRTDEWYDFHAAPVGEATRLLNLDESSYQGGTMGDDHPIAWFRAFDGGRTIYTAGGHTTESYDEPDFRRHLLGALLWAAGLAE